MVFSASAPYITAQCCADEHQRASGSRRAGAAYRRGSREASASPSGKDRILFVKLSFTSFLPLSVVVLASLRRTLSIFHFNFDDTVLGSPPFLWELASVLNFGTLLGDIS